MFMKIKMIKASIFLLAALLLILAGAAAAIAAPARNSQKTFASPQEALQSLVKAARSSNIKELIAILGPGSRQIISSGDPVADRAGREHFIKLYDEKNSAAGADSGRAFLIIGNEDYPFPIPVIKKGNVWRFDAKAGKEEILNRRIGRNELEVINVMRTYVDAQREYASRDRDSDAVMEFAQKFRSTPGKKDGLYWETADGAEMSPMGSLVAKAGSEGYAMRKGDGQEPYQGYLFKIIKAQGADAEGGAFDYVVNGKMILGFALLAYPANYGSSGIMTFVVNQNGIVYQKNLGKKTASTAAAIKLYNPDSSWKKVE